MTHTILIDGRSLTVDDVEAVAGGGVRVGLAADAADRVLASRRVVDDILSSGQVVYGVNTGSYFAGSGESAPAQPSPIPLVRCW